MTLKVWLGLFVLSFVAYIAGLINPKWVIWWGRRRTRGQAMIIYGALMVVFAALFMITGPLVVKQVPVNSPVETYLDEEMTLKAEKAKEAVNTLLIQRGYDPLTQLVSDEGYIVYASEKLGLYLSMQRDPGVIQIEWNTVGLEATSNLDGKLVDLAFEAFTLGFLSGDQVRDLMQALREVCREADKLLAESPSGEVRMGQAERRVPYGRVLAISFCRKTGFPDREEGTVEKSIQLAKFKPLTEP
jgi:hypothetical protein